MLREPCRYCNGDGTFETYRNVRIADYTEGCTEEEAKELMQYIFDEDTGEFCPVCNGTKLHPEDHIATTEG